MYKGWGPNDFWPYRFNRFILQIDAPASALALQSLIEASLGSLEQHSWEVGWSLASQTNGPHSSKEVIQSQVCFQLKFSYTKYNILSNSYRLGWIISLIYIMLLFPYI